jgi:hypothetical protein
LRAEPKKRLAVIRWDILSFRLFGCEIIGGKICGKWRLARGEGERRRTVSMEAVDIQTWTTMSMKIDNRGTEKKGYRR